MLISNKALQTILASGAFKIEVIEGFQSPEFEPVYEWARTEDGKSYRTNVQTELNGLPLWQITARVSDVKYGQATIRDEVLFVRSSTKPTLELDLFGGDENA